MFLITSVCFDFDRWSLSYGGYKYKEDDLKGTQNHFELARGSSYPGFELLGVKL